MPAHKKIALSAASAINIRVLRSVSPLPLICPYHHVVSDEPIPYIDPLYRYKSTNQFEQDLDYLLTHFEPVTLREVAEGRHLSFRRKAFLVCFDDGFRQVADTVAPLLLRKGVPAAVFINPAFIDNKEVFYAVQKGYLLHLLSLTGLRPSFLKEASVVLGRPLADAAALALAVRGIGYHGRGLLGPLGDLFGVDWAAFIKTYRPFMTLPEVLGLARVGFGIGAHSMDHPLYSELPLADQVAQTLSSTAWVTSHLSPGYTAFAFPHVDTGVGASFFSKVAGLDVIFGNSTGRSEDHVLHRFIGENPSVPMEKMVKGVLAYSALAAGRPPKRSTV